MNYDKKFRERGLSYWAEGQSKKAKVFKVSTYTLQKWKSQLKGTGDLEPKSAGKHGARLNR